MNEWLIALVTLLVGIPGAWISVLALLEHYKHQRSRGGSEQ